MQTHKPNSKTTSNWRREVDHLLDEFMNPPGTWELDDDGSFIEQTDIPLATRVSNKIEISRALVLRLKYERGKRLLETVDHAPSAAQKPAK